MRKKLKLSFDLLEDTLTLISPLEAAYVLGGNGDGSGWDPSSNFNETIEYFQSQGFSFSQDESGNLFFTSGGTYSGPAIQLDQVVVNGVVYKPEDDSGSDNPFASGIAAMLERFLEDRDGSETEYDGSDGSDGSVDTYEGPVGGTGDTGGTGGNSNTGDPWKRVNGELVITPTNHPNTTIDYRGTSTVGIDQVKLTLEEVIIKDKNNNDIIAYRVIKYTDQNDVDHTDIPDKYKSNCHGSAMGLDLWIYDPYTPGAEGNDTVHEDLAFQEMAENYTSSYSDSSVISYYYNSMLMHSIRRDPNTGEIWSTTDIGEVKHYNNITDFYHDNTQYPGMTRKYYRF